MPHAGIQCQSIPKLPNKSQRFKVFLSCCLLKFSKIERLIGLLRWILIRTLWEAKIPDFKFATKYCTQEPSITGTKAIQFMISYFFGLFSLSSRKIELVCLYKRENPAQCFPSRAQFEYASKL